MVLGGYLHLIDDGDCFLQQRWLGDQENSIFHVLGKERLLAIVDVLDERERLVPDMDEHLLGRVMLPVGPPAIHLSLIDGSVRESLSLRFLLFEGVHCFEPVHEDEVGHLLDGLERVGEPAAPEFIPERVDLGIEFGGEAHSGDS